MGRRDRTLCVGENIVEAALGFGLEQRNEPLRVGTRKLPEIARALRQTHDEPIEHGVSRKELDQRLPAGRICDFGAPVAHTRTGLARGGKMLRGPDALCERTGLAVGAFDRPRRRRIHWHPGSISICQAPRKRAPAQLYPCVGSSWLIRRSVSRPWPRSRPDAGEPGIQLTAATDAARGSEMTVLRPGWLSSSLSSPPWRRATAEARLRPNPEPGFERLCSSRTKRSTARPRSASGMPWAPSATASRIRSPSPTALTTISAAAPFAPPAPSGAPYLMALSTRLASARLMRSRFP